MSEVYRYSIYEEAMEVIRTSGWVLEYIRPDLITPELALVAVKDRAWALQFVPAHCQTQEVIEAALKQDPKAKKFIKVKEMFKGALGEALDE
jgi:hypothetical protein